jgi:acyl carrier protein phosphodiesterase
VNLLAHALLADGSSASIFGNVIADFLRPAEVERLPSAVRDGVRLHRQVDAFTDRHPVVQRSIARVSRRWGWFSGILIDVYYDHVLASDWDHHVGRPLRTFIDTIHAAVWEHSNFVPDPARDWIVRFVEADRFMSYAAADGSGVALALEGLSARIAARMPHRAVRLQDAMPDLRLVHQELADDFGEFLPLVRAFAAGRHGPQTPAARGFPHGPGGRSHGSVT